MSPSSNGWHAACGPCHSATNNRRSSWYDTNIRIHHTIANHFPQHFNIWHPHLLNWELLTLCCCLKSTTELERRSPNFIVTGWDRSFWKTDSWFMPFIISVAYLYCGTWFLCLSLGILGLATLNLGASFWAGTLCSTLGSYDVTLGTRFAGLGWWVLMSRISHCSDC